MPAGPAQPGSAALAAAARFDLRVESDAEAMSAAAANLIEAELCEHPDLLIGAATGATPTRTYERLAARAAAAPRIFARVRLLKVDEWGGLNPDDPATCEVYLQAKLVRPLGIAPDRYISWNSNPADPQQECRRMATWLEANGPIDRCVLGLGANGHLAFNEPADTLELGPHVAELSEQSLAHPMLTIARSRPQFGLTIGIGDILRARRILLLVSGAHKAIQLRRLMDPAGISTQFPASLLALHSRVTVMCDTDAARLMEGASS